MLAKVAVRLKWWAGTPRARTDSGTAGTTTERWEVGVENEDALLTRARELGPPPTEFQFKHILFCIAFSGGISRPTAAWGSCLTLRKL